MRFTLLLAAALFLNVFSFTSDMSIESIKDSKMALEKIEEQLTNRSATIEQNLQVQNSNTNSTYNDTDDTSDQSQDDSSDPKMQEAEESTTHSYEKAFIKMIFILVVILGVVFVVFYLFKRFSGSRMAISNHSKSIKIIEKRAISPKSMLYLVEIGGQKILLAESQLEIRNVSDLSWIENSKQGL
ncbi:MAG: hypothetical protein S4CHLAM37_14440 [Chlamydiia bacterium]|nr:hypothetical protein [Chlamydiia bacterium]